jgi:hypothetical protein
VPRALACVAGDADGVGVPPRRGPVVRASSGHHRREACVGAARTLGGVRHRSGRVGLSADVCRPPTGPPSRKASWSLGVGLSPDACRPWKGPLARRTTSLRWWACWPRWDRAKEAQPRGRTERRCWWACSPRWGRAKEAHPPETSAESDMTAPLRPLSVSADRTTLDVSPARQTERQPRRYRRQQRHQRPQHDQRPTTSVPGACRATTQHRGTIEPPSTRFSRPSTLQALVASCSAATAGARPAAATARRPTAAG